MFNLFDILGNVIGFIGAISFYALALYLLFLIPSPISLIISYFLLKNGYKGVAPGEINGIIQMGYLFLVVGAIKLIWDLYRIWNKITDKILDKKYNKMLKKANKMEEKLKEELIKQMAEEAIINEEIFKNETYKEEIKRRFYEKQRGNENNIYYKTEYELACEFFGVSKETSYKDKRNIFKALVRLYHPDINKNKMAEIKMKEVNNNWDIIENYEN